jgi:cell division protein FtsW (lipid II flippase)
MILNRNIKIIILGIVVGGISFHILANTYVLQNVEAVRRMRTAFNATEDASFIVRIENRRILDEYMKDKPFGGGVGSAGVWGHRFSPDSFLAHFETDGHYVRIYAETGIVGLSIYLLLFVGLLIKMSWITWHMRNPKLKNICAAFTGGFAAIMAANYSAAVIIGLPTAAVICFHIAYVFMAEKWDNKLTESYV